MNYQEKVENAQSKAQEEFDNCVGDLLDANKEQQDDDCREEGTTAPDAFMALDPDDMANSESSVLANGNDGFYKKIELYNLDHLCAETRNLDTDQRLTVDIGVSFVQKIHKHLNHKFSTSPPPLIVAHGGAGCGKSHVINLMTQWQEHILRKSGDNPNHPYV